DSGINAAHKAFDGRVIQGYINESSADIDGHRTHCAGIAGGEVFGVTPKANLIAVKVRW
ncbi:hypothetical protein K469DRAFT_559808, partial [Zopfia rhizophila CBS 207.26]